MPKSKNPKFVKLVSPKTL